MKTFLPKQQKVAFFALYLLIFSLTGAVQAQSGSGGGSSNLSQGLKFDGYSKISGTDLQVGAEYLFAQVNDSADAVVRIDSLINGATINKLDDNSNGTGYKDAFQPAIKSGGIIGKSYAVFTISFYRKGTTTPIILKDVYSTGLDIDGNSTLKEFAEINVGNGGTMQYMSTSSDISVLQMLPGTFMGMNVSGIERSGIDTSSYNNMFTASNTIGISSINVKVGTFTTVPTNSTRQFSVYMKGFYYPSSTLPAKLTSFTATLSANKMADLKWQTSTELNTSHFVIERSLDGNTFNDIGMVFAYGNSTDLKNYEFADNVKNLNATVIYYRLRQVDIDEKVEYSSTRIVRISNKENNAISILAYPNPVSNEVRVTIPADWQNKAVVYEVFNMSGQVATRLVSANSGQTEILNVSRLNKGMYIIRAICEGKTAQQKIIKQ